MVDRALDDAMSLHLLEKRDVQRICSGQSVVDLATAVKEMVENALDAGATRIEVKLKDFGKDTIEVSDNGAGIAPANYSAVARKHYTSKISCFEDIETVTSFGFRGEALSSICELVGSFTVCTRTATDDIGALLAFDRTGALTQQTPKARPIGTTITITDLFQPLAVRHKDFHRNIKRHYAKLLKVLQAYAVSAASVQLQVVNVTGSSTNSTNRNVVLATQATQSVKSNIANVFGAKFAQTLVVVDCDLSTAWRQLQSQHKRTAALSRQKKKRRRQLERLSVGSSSESESENENDDADAEADGEEEDDQASATATRRVVGFVSRVGAGVGRSDNDRQFLFINGRPFDLPKVAKALNDVWRQFEMKNKPACVLDLLLPPSDYDVNVTPDKRETFLKHEREILEAFKVELVKLFEPSRGTFTVQPLLASFARSATSASAVVHAKTTATTKAPSASSEAQHSLLRPHVATAAAAAVAPYPTAVIVEVLSPKRKRDATTSNKKDADDAAAMVVLQSVASPSPNSNNNSSSSNTCCTSSSSSDTVATVTAAAVDAAQQRPPPPPLTAIVEQPPRDKRPRVDERVIVIAPSPPLTDASSIDSAAAAFRATAQTTEWSLAELTRQRAQFFADEAADERVKQRRLHRLAVPKACSAGGDVHPKDAVDAIDNTNDAAAAAALQRVLKKDDFQRMAVLGQFNLGFIVAQLDDDLFIIDQHASDEKFTFETLQQTTVLHQQPLVRPMALELTATEELVVLEHIDVFATNGFTFRVDPNAPATRKLQLLSLPFTKHTQFGVEDIRELASLLMDASPLTAATIRLPKITAMFASRACRSSVMIGTALHKEEMQKIVRNLAGLEQPWNCPHGRPTLRHLLDLRQLYDQQ